MKITLDWLKERVEIPVDTDTLIEQLNMAGLEVDACEPVAPAFDHVVVGKIIVAEQHPNADKLKLCQVDVGEEKHLSIICGAPNAATGMKVAVAKIGAKLPVSEKMPEGLTIKKAKLRGVESCGMLCSAAELGISDEADGIMDLSDDLQIGQCLRQALSLDDVIIEIDLTPNRGDCLGMKGLAREVAVLNRSNLLQQKIEPVAPSCDAVIDVKLSAPEYCPRYLGRVIKGIDASAKSPAWLVQKLERCGLRSISPVVDVTNYVLLELGHPMHGFDLSQIQGGIDVRMAHLDEQLVLLDDNANKVDLRPDTLLIADHQKPLAIAGVMGGEHSGVSNDTQDVLLESAFFNPVLIAGQARSYGLATDAAHRYERGVDPQLQRDAMELATRTLMDIVGGDAGPIVEAVAEEHIPKKSPIILRPDRIERILGIAFEDAEVVDVLSRLGMQVEANEEGWSVLPPSYRFDISIEEDLIEELVRIYGYNKLAMKTPVGHLQLSPEPEVNIGLQQYNQALVNRGYQEVITYSFVAPEQQALLSDIKGVELKNPISADLAEMRTNLLSGLIKTAQYNTNRQQNRIRIFESGQCFVPQAAGSLAQDNYIGGLICGSQKPESWAVETQAVDFYDIKVDVEALLALSNDLQSYQFEAAELKALHPGQTALIKKHEQVVGWLGALHPSVIETFDLPKDSFVFQLQLSVINTRELPQFQAVSRFPTARRDLSFLLDEEQNIAPLCEFVKQLAGNQLKDVIVSDIYQGKGIDFGRKSATLGLIFSDPCRNLNDNEIADAMHKVSEGLIGQYGVTLRA